MGLYKLPNSPYWWMYLEPTRQKSSTKIRHTGTTPERTRELRELARHAYETALIALRRGELGLSTSQPIAFDALAEWYGQHVGSLKRGAERERWAVRRLVAHFGSLPVASIDTPAIVEWRAARAAQVSAGTVNRELAVLKAIFRAGIPRYLAVSPAAAVRDIRPQRGQRTAQRRPRILTPAEETRLLEVMTRPDDRALFLLALCTLARLSDLLDLTWADVKGKAVIIRDPKTGRPYDVPLSKKAAAALKALPKMGAHLFPRFRVGTPAERRNRVKMWLKRKCERAKVPYGRKGGVTFHTARHTGASRMVDAGVDLRTVQDIGGWSSLRMVERYTHPTPQAKRKAVEAI